MKESVLNQVFRSVHFERAIWKTALINHFLN